MLYQIKQDHYHRFDVIGVNRLPERSYFVPYESRESADAVTSLQKRYSSAKVQCLNGIWDFRFFDRPAQLPDVLDTQAEQFDSIPVPGCWQSNGFGRPFYVNTRYQFPFDPPKIPKEEPVGRVFCNSGSDGGIRPRWYHPQDEYNWAGVYRRGFYINGGKRYILTFLGVASCVDVYVNGQFVGYGEGSHHMTEFDITPFVNAGDNELVAVVHRWCTGTYLECQDMFRYNGIFRDVLLTELDQEDIWDISFRGRKEDDWKAYLECQTTADTQLTVTLCGHGFMYQTSCRTEEQKLSLTIPMNEPKLWNAEEPNLYDLYVTTQNTCVKLRVGFVQVKADTVFTVNGQPVKLHGVNHHDTHPVTGYYMTPEDILRDIRLCKEHNIDTIRTSHYPPDPLLLELCDEMGIYVVDEADLETHGAVSMLPVPKFGAITHDRRWEKHYLDRAAHLYERDKNHPAIILWSLGNEAGGYHNTDAMYAWLKERTDIPVHYESVIHSKRVAYDVGSEMYPTLDMVRSVAERSRKEKPLNDRPYFLCEYAHAMGVGPGAMEEYWKIIYDADNLMGGCVWEMVDHAVAHSDGSYTYGGDHGEWEHDGNFCVDGIFYPDRTPSTGARIVKHVYRPLRLRHLGADHYEVFNTRSFTDAKAYELRFEFPDGSVKRYAVSVPPLSKKTVRFSGCFLNEDGVEAVTIHKETGKEVGREQLGCAVNVAVVLETDDRLPALLDIVDGQVRFVKDGAVMTLSDPETILFRAPTDNDIDFLLRTPMDDYLQQRQMPVSMRVEKNRVIIVNRIVCHKHSFLCTDVYEGVGDGVLLTSTLEWEKGKGDLPRFGKTFHLPSEFDHVIYHGRAGESYCDMKEHVPVRTVSCPVKDMMEPNIRPQESGNRSDCAWVRLSNGHTEFEIRAVETPFELGVKPCTDRELLTMRHREDVLTTGTYVTASAFQMGIGTGSCGPATLSEYRYDCTKTYVLKLLIE